MKVVNIIQVTIPYKQSSQKETAKRIYTLLRLRLLAQYKVGENQIVDSNENSIKKLQQSQTFLEYSSKNDITFFNNNIPLNLFSSKEELLNQINNFENKLKTIMKSLNLLENKEFSRLIKEFNFKNYSKKFNISKKGLFALIFPKKLILQFSNK